MCRAIAGPASTEHRNTAAPISLNFSLNFVMRSSSRLGNAGNQAWVRKEVPVLFSKRKLRFSDDVGVLRGADPFGANATVLHCFGRVGDQVAGDGIRIREPARFDEFPAPLRALPCAKSKPACWLRTLRL